MTTINPGVPGPLGTWRTAEDRSSNADIIRDRITPGGTSPPDEGGGQPQILSVVSLNGNARVTVSCPDVPGADRFEWWAGSNTGPERWALGSQEFPNVSFTSQVEFDAPRQQDVDDSSFFCYRGANVFGPAPNFNCNGFVIDGVEAPPSELGAPTIDSAASTQDGESVVLMVTPGANAENHDVHRILGNATFTASDLNRIATNIGPLPASYGDLGASPDNIYSYRLTSKKSGLTPVQSNQVSVSTSVAGSGFDPAFRPNEPAGYTRWAEHNCTYLALGGDPLSHEGVGTGFAIGGNYDGTFADPTSSGGGSIRVRFPQGLSGGSSPGTFNIKKSGVFETTPALREWYISIWFYFEPNPADGGWEFHPVSQKLFYRGALVRDRPNALGPVHCLGTGTGSAGVRTTIRGARSSVRPRWDDVAKFYNSTAVQPPIGSWVQLEMHEVKSDPDVENGIMRTWWNNTLVFNDTAVQNQSAGQENGLFNVHFAPVWGGSANFTKGRDDFMRFGHIYVSGILE